MTNYDITEHSRITHVVYNDTYKKKKMNYSMKKKYLFTNIFKIVFKHIRFASNSGLLLKKQDFSSFVEKKLNIFFEKQKYYLF